MTAAPLASPPADPPAHLGLPAPFLALPHPQTPSTLRRNGAGVGVAVLLHGALLAGLTIAVGPLQPPLTPPQATIAVSLATPEAPAPKPAPQPRPQVQPKAPTPTPRTPQTPAPQARATDKPAIAAAPVASNTAETSAAPAPTAPPTPTAPTAPVAVVPPRFDAAYLSNPLPPYPSAAKRMGEEGRVLLRVQVGADGRPTDVTVVKSCGFPRLDESARDTVLRSWRFVPARQGDQPVAGAVKVPIDFTLTSAS